MNLTKNTYKLITVSGLFVAVGLGIVVTILNYYNYFAYSDSRPKRSELSSLDQDYINPEVKFSFLSAPTKLNHSVVAFVSREELILAGDYKETKYMYSQRFENYSEVLIPLNNIDDNGFVLSVSDKNGNKVNKFFSKQRLENDSNTTIDFISPFPEAFVIANPDIDSLVNSKYRLSATFEPQDLVDLREIGIATSSSGIYLRMDSARYLKEMQDALNSLGIEMIVTSGYRSFDFQTFTYNYISDTEGQEEAQSRAAIPGSSEHQLGLAVDIVNQETNFQLPSPGQRTILYNWLTANAYKYGFVQTYDGSDTTIREEQWHWRYVGVELAEEIKKSGKSPLVYLESLYVIN